MASSSSSQELIRRQVGEVVVGTKARVSMLVRVVSALWLLEAADFLVFAQRLDLLGIRPRELSGLWGIVTAPLLHGGFGHLLANTVPLVVLGFLASTRKRLDFYVVAAGSALTAGLGTWLIGGAGTVHIGASGVVFGFLGFLMGRGFFERSASTIALSVMVTFLFGGMLWGVLPTVGAGISWEGHLFGFLGGLLVSRLLGNALRQRRLTARS